jgi:hypothetical protein
MDRACQGKVPSPSRSHGLQFQTLWAAAKRLTGFEQRRKAKPISRRLSQSKTWRQAKSFTAPPSHRSTGDFRTAPMAAGRTWSFAFARAIASRENDSCASRCERFGRLADEARVLIGGNMRLNPMRGGAALVLCPSGFLVALGCRTNHRRVDRRVLRTQAPFVSRSRAMAANRL